ncbi:synaptonemal complex central element protein 3 [Silurus meridionalis]|uniref:synaptonemal complex central element protein 3 n=1 Tax=Silurus meridionalis TaxID=175797 RepID=UPI001EEC4A82|nr:synaptonemal complex central element protein 3 [Silurus meridionalis]
MNFALVWESRFWGKESIRTAGSLSLCACFKKGLRGHGNKQKLMVDNTSFRDQITDFRRETLEISKDLERMTEQMENISVNVTWMAYDTVAMRTDPELAKSLKRLEDELVQCKAVISGSKDNLVDQYNTAAIQKTAQE